MERIFREKSEVIDYCKHLQVPGSIIQGEKSKGIFKINVYLWIPSYKLTFLRAVYSYIGTTEYDNQ